MLLEAMYRPPAGKGRRITKIWVVMRFTAIILLAACLQVSAKGYSQQITLSRTNVALKQVLKEIETQSGYRFFYREKPIREAGNVTLQVKGASVRQALDRCLENTSLTYEILDRMIVVKERKLPAPVETSVAAEARLTVKGIVKDEKGGPLPGVSVSVRGTKRGTSTAPDGTFSITAQTGDILDFSYIGFKKQSHTIESGADILIRLETDAIAQNEIVVVGYGTQKKANLTGAVDMVGSEVLENRPITRISQGLQGTVGNLNILSNGSGGAPNATQSLNIRGYTGFGNRGGPLLVIDGIPGGDINTINPGDVESISVLKDQASAAIYGVDGAFGVILITTKQGKKGKSPQITYDNNFSFSQLANTPRQVGSLEYAEMWNEASGNAGAGPIYPDDQIQRIKAFLDGSLKTETQPNAAGTDWINGQEANANNDWFDILFRDWSRSQQHNLGVSGGGTGSQYYVGLGYSHRQGMYSYGNDDFKRYNLRVNLGVDVTSWAKFNLRTAFSRSRSDAPFDYPARTGGGLGGYMHQAARVAPMVPLFNPDGNLSNFSDPAWMASGSRTIDNEDQNNLTGEFVVTPLKGLDITGNYTLFTYNSESSSNGKTFYIPRPDGSQATFGINPNTFSRTFAKNNNHLVNLYAQYSRDFGDHHVKVLGGYIRRFNETLSSTARNSNLYTDNLPSLALTYNDKPFVTDAVGEMATEGFFGRVNYDYKDKFLLELDARYDATSRFISNRWKMYPGVSAGYVISREAFWEPLLDVVSSLKFRGSYGKSGDQGSFALYPFYPALNTVAPPNTGWFFPNGRQAYVSAPGVINPDITWQQPVMLDYGVEASFLRDRLQLVFSRYKRTMKNMVVAAEPLPAIFGTPAPTVNNGEMETRGFELTLGWNDRIGEFKYSVRGVLSDYSGKVTRYPNPTKLLGGTYYVGSRIGEIWGYNSSGLFPDAETAAKAPKANFNGYPWKAGDVIYEDRNHDGIISPGLNTADSSGDRSVIGNNTPRYAYSLNLDVSWKGFDMNIFLQGIGKRDLWVGSNYFWGITGNRFQSSWFDIHRNRWTAENPGGYYPKYYMSNEMDKNMQVQTRYLQNGAYLRFKSVQLGYTLPASMLNRWHIRKARLFVTGENLLTFTRMAKSLDPELAAVDAGSGIGKVYPLQRTYAFGINIGL